MITNAIIEAMIAIAAAVLGLVPAAPPELVDGMDLAIVTIGDVVATISPYEVVIPFSTFFQVAGMAVAAMILQIAIRFLRIGLSFVTLGGGAT